MGSGPLNWRKQSIVAGPVGVLESPSPLSFMSSDGRPGKVTKMPILVEGHKPVRVSTSTRDTGRVRLYFSRSARQFSSSAGYTSVLFEPCPDRRSTPFPGGVRITGSAPVTLIVERPDGSGKWRLPLGAPRQAGDDANDS
jgi:hypothetical protein